MSTTTMTAAVAERKKFVGRGDFTRERHEWPELSDEEISAGIRRLQAQYPERLTIKPVKWAGG